MQITFKKSGKVIKVALNRKIGQLEQQLIERNQVLSHFLDDTQKVRAYIIQSTQSNGYPNLDNRLLPKHNPLGEEMEEISKLARRICELEQEIHKLRLMQKHMDDEEVFELEYGDLIGYGFESGPGGF